MCSILRWGIAGIFEKVVNVEFYWKRLFELPNDKTNTDFQELKKYYVFNIPINKLIKKYCQILLTKVMNYALPAKWNKTNCLLIVENGRKKFSYYNFILCTPNELCKSFTLSINSIYQDRPNSLAKRLINNRLIVNNNTAMLKKILCCQVPWYRHNGRPRAGYWR